MNAQNPGTSETIKEIFDAMDKLSQRPYEYFITGLGFILLLLGIFGSPLKSISQDELLAISIFGVVGLLSGLAVSLKKADYTMRTNVEKIGYKKFLVEQKTKRLELTNRENGSAADLSDLESF